MELLTELQRHSEAVSSEYRHKWRHGDIVIWVDPATGIPVRVVGQVPLGSMLDIGVDMQLASYTGTPESFVPVGTQHPESEDESGEPDEGGAPH